MQKFEPKINRTLFRQRILEIQEYEGNSTLVVETIKEKLKKTDDKSFYDNFIKDL